MSQAGIVDFESSHPQVPTKFVTNSGTAIPIANTLEILATTVAAHNIPIETTGSGNTVTVVAQYASAAASSVAANAGFASFNSADFNVDANGYVTLSGGATVESFMVDAATAPGTNPVVPSVSGIVTVTGGQVPAGTTTNVILTNSLAANTYTIQIQRSQAVASSTVGDNGVSHFNSTYFTVDSNGFVSLNGSGVGETITGNTGGALSPTSGNWNILGSSTAPGTTPVQTSGSGSTLTVQVQKSQAIASTNATNVGLAAFNSTYFTVDSNGFVSLNGSGVGETITGNAGGALSPTSGNWNIYGTSTAAGTTPVQTSGSGSTLTVQVQKSQAIASTNATNVGLAAFNSTYFTVDSNGFVSLNGSGVGETITGNSGGALSPTAGNWNIVGTGSITTSGSVSTLTVQLTGLTNHALLVGAGTATITNVGPSSTTGQVLQSQGSSSDPAFSTTTYPSTSATGNLIYASATNVYSNLAIGSTGNLLQVSGGIPAWTAPIFFSQINVQTFTGSGTYTPTSGMKYCMIECQAGGGGGGGAGSGTSAAAGGQGGGGGGYARKFASAATIGSSQTVTVGAGGTGGSNTPGAGGGGGTTSVGSICNASGGGGGTAGTNSATITFKGTGGAGGGGLAGDFFVTGSTGGYGWANFPGGFTMGGNGGGSHFGGATKPAPLITSGTQTSGNSGISYGGGSSGAAIYDSGTPAGANPGAAGIVVITEYI